jgi:predicted DNA-binding transcriptional regulator AlpA
VASITTDELLTTEELSALLRVPTATLNTWRSRGGGPPFIKVGRLPRYATSDVREWLEGRKSTTQEPNGVAPVADASERGGASSGAPSSISDQAPSLHPDESSDRDESAS